MKPAMPGTAKSYSCDGGVLRCVTAEVEYDGKMLEMSFLTNNMEWSARTIAELYRARWGIETFFKELKQTLHRLQRERGQVAGLDGAPGAHAPALPPPRLEMEAQLLAARGRGAGVRVAAAQRCGTARILRREWDSTWWNPRGAGLQTPVFAGFPAVRRRTNGGCVQVVGIFKNTGCNTNFRTLRTHSHAEWDGSDSTRVCKSNFNLLNEAISIIEKGDSLPFHCILYNKSLCAAIVSWAHVFHVNLRYRTCSVTLNCPRCHALSMADFIESVSKGLRYSASHP